MQSQLTVRLPEDLDQEVTNAAKRLRLKRSDIVRLALEQFLREPRVQEEETPYGNVKHLLGSVKSGIPDLGTSHREHLVKQIIGRQQMPIIKPMSSLRNKTGEIASLCHEQDAPVYLTTNGEGDLVVMSIEHYEKMSAKIDLFEKLAVAQSQSASGEKGITHSQMMQKLRHRSHAG